MKLQHVKINVFVYLVKLHVRTNANMFFQDQCVCILWSYLYVNMTQSIMYTHHNLLINMFHYHLSSSKLLSYIYPNTQYFNTLWPITYKLNWSVFMNFVFWISQNKLYNTEQIFSFVQNLSKKNTKVIVTTIKFKT